MSEPTLTDAIAALKRALAKHPTTTQREQWDKRCLQLALHNLEDLQLWERQRAAR